MKNLVKDRLLKSNYCFTDEFKKDFCCFTFYVLYCWTVRWNVSKHITLRKLVSLSLNDHILHAAMIVCLTEDGGVSKYFRCVVTTEIERIVGVGDNEISDTYSRLCKDFVHWQFDTIFVFDSKDLMPLTITEFMLIIWSKCCRDDFSSTIVNLNK